MAANDNTVPVYLITGFLDSGKTNFLKFTMQEDYFNDGSRTLLILCEEGEEDYPVKVLRKTHTEMEIIDEESDLTAEKLEELNKKYHPERVLIEFNGMWSVPNFLKTPLPDKWLLYQIITVLDGENFGLYLNNIKNTSMELLTNTDMVIFNRCTEDTDLVLYQRTTRSVNSRCDIIFEDKDGGELECPEPDLPYSLEDDPLKITDENYGTFYIDINEHPERYEGKQIEILVQIMQNKSFPKNIFIGGRRAMTCCVEDIRFLPWIFIYDKAKSLPAKDYANITSTFRWEFNEGYQGEGPVFHVNDVKLATKPAEELITF
ncbi:MAG: GTPase [Lachnospiraceae bacterium]|nr:GTPase [Lachnospiraceae bacterium]